jgi:flagellar biosynthesis/type III secretory pathway chaperone
MDAALCRDTLSRLVADETSALTELERILDIEHQALVANDVDALVSAGETRHRHVAALVRVEEERRSLCRAMDVPADPRGLQQLLDQCDSTREIAKRWVKCAALAARCRRSNDRNGALVAARMKHVEQVLSLITRNTAGTYGRRGSAAHVAAGRVVATRA